MKILILSIIVLVIPLFFALIFVLGTYNRLATLRRRCHALPLGSVDTNAAGGQSESRRAVDEYNAARTAFPASVIAALFGFGPPDESTNGRGHSTASRPDVRQ